MKLNIKRSKTIDNLGRMLIGLFVKSDVYPDLWSGVIVDVFHWEGHCWVLVFRNKNSKINGDNCWAHSLSTKDGIESISIDEASGILLSKMYTSSIVKDNRALRTERMPRRQFSSFELTRICRQTFYLKSLQH